MTTSDLPLAPAQDEAPFQTAQALPILAGHFAHDIYTSCVAPLLPVLIEKLSLSLTAAGSLSAMMQLPALLNPFIGYLADRVNVRYFIILAPAITGTLISLMGFAPSYAALAILLLAVGLSNSIFHAPAPALVARVSGRRVGLGMSLFMVGGELGYTVGPLLAVWAVSTWTLDGFWRLMFLGWAASLLLFLRLRQAEAAHPEKPGSLRAVIPALWSLFLPIALFNLFRNPLIESLSTYLPTYLSGRGAALTFAGASLSIVQVAGVVGVLLIGGISDRFGRKRVLMTTQLLAALLMLAFLRFGQGWLAIPLLLSLGLTAFSVLPLLLVIVQEQFPKNRAVANGLYMMILFLLRPLGTLMVGFLGDRLGLQTTFYVAALLSLLTLPAVWMMPSARHDL